METPELEQYDDFLEERHKLMAGSSHSRLLISRCKIVRSVLLFWIGEKMALYKYPNYLGRPPELEG